MSLNAGQRQPLWQGHAKDVSIDWSVTPEHLWILNADREREGSQLLIVYLSNKKELEAPSASAIERLPVFEELVMNEFHVE